MYHDSCFAQDQDPRDCECFSYNAYQTKPTGSESTDESSGFAAPVSLAVLEQWSRYATFCFALTRQIDWREIFAFIDDDDDHVRQCSSSLKISPPPGKYDASNCNKAPTHNVASCYPTNWQSCIAFKKAMESDSQRRFGAGVMRFHQQRLFRWTRALTKAIGDRLTDIIANGKPIPSEELLRYRLVFANRASRVVGAILFLPSLLVLLETAESKELPLYTASDSTVSRDGHSQRSPPQRLSLSPALAMSLTSLSSRENYRTAQCLSALLSQCLNALWTDVLQISWEHVDPKIVPDIVHGHLEALLNGKARTYQYSEEERHMVFSDTLRPLMMGDEAIKSNTHEKNPLQRNLVSEYFSPLNYIQTHQVSMALRVLETVGYVMISKFRFGYVKECYYALPLLSEYNVLISIMEKKCERLPGMLGEMCELLFRLTALLYTESVERELNHYHKTASKKLLRFGKKGDKKKTMSAATFSILQKVVEPTLIVLSMIGPLTQSVRFLFIRRVVGMMVEVINQHMLETESESKASSASKEQCKTERQLIIEYIDTHSLSRRLVEVSALADSSGV